MQRLLICFVCESGNKKYILFACVVLFSQNIGLACSGGENISIKFQIVDVPSTALFSYRF